MTYAKPIAMFAAVALSIVAAPVLSAQTSDDETIITFSQPVELPGVALPAGTYIFRMVEGREHPRIVQVLSEDSSRVFAMIQGQDRNLSRAQKPGVQLFNEASSGAPVAVRSWIRPDSSFTAVDLIYPKAQAQEIASAVHEHVLGGGLPHVG